MPRQPTHLRFFAIVDGSCGYVLDYAPGDAQRYRRAFGRRIVGDFGTLDEADDAVAAELRKRNGGEAIG
jgi:hypothetical protein